MAVRLAPNPRKSSGDVPTPGDSGDTSTNQAIVGKPTPLRTTPRCDPPRHPKMDHGVRCGPTMFRKQVSRPVDGLEPAWWPPRRSRSSELEERPGHGPNPRFLCPSALPAPDPLARARIALPMNGRQWNERPPHVQELPYRQITTRQFDVRTLNLEPNPDRRGVRMGVLSNHNPLDFSPLGFVR